MQDNAFKKFFRRRKKSSWFNVRWRGYWCRSEARLSFIACISTPSSNQVNCLLEYQARMEYGFKSLIVSEPRTLGDLVLPLWGILMLQLPSIAQSEAAAISSIHREFTDLRNIPQQRVISFFYLDCSVIYLSSRATKRHYGRISSSASAFIRLCAPSIRPHFSYSYPTRTGTL